MQDVDSAVTEIMFFFCFFSVKECEMRHRGIKKVKPSQRIPWRNREPKFVCDTCGYRTKGKAALDRHIKGKHSIPHSFNCKECGKTFKSKSILETHLSIHKEKIPRTTEDDKPVDQLKPESSSLSLESPQPSTSFFWIQQPSVSSHPLI